VDQDPSTLENSCVSPAINTSYIIVPQIHLYASYYKVNVLGNSCGVCIMV
jgi:hypothetical protein